MRFNKWRNVRQRLWYNKFKIETSKKWFWRNKKKRN